MALRIVRLLDKAVKFVCKEPSKLVSKLVFCHTVIVDEVITLVIKCTFGSHAEKAMSSSVISIEVTTYFRCRNIILRVDIGS